jgi:hypothetical protein
VSYLPNTLLSYVSFLQNEPLTSKVSAPFHTDVGRRPSTVCAIDNAEKATLYSSINNGNYNFEADNSKLMICFGPYTGNSKFNSLAKLKIMANNDDITETVYSSIFFPNNCYKIIVYGKNKAGKLIGKYVGYSLGKNFEYWNINPESSSFGKSGTRTF